MTTITKITNLDGDFVRVSSGETVAIDAGANVTLPANAAISKMLLMFGMDGRLTAEDQFSIASGKGVTLTNGMNEGSKIFIGGQEVGRISLSAASQFEFVFNNGVASDKIETFIKALNYTNNRTDNSVVDQREISIVLSNADDTWATEARIVATIAPTNARVLTSAVQTSAGSDGDDIFVVDALAINAGDKIQGESGGDTIYLIGGEEFDLSIAEISGVEAIESKSSADAFNGHSVTISADQLTDVTSLEGGAHSDDRLHLKGAALDLRGKSITGFESIHLWTDAAEAKFADKVTALLARGINSQNDHLILEGASFTAAEKQQLFEQGIDKITDASGTSENKPPVVGALNGDQVIITSSAPSAFIDADRNATISDTDNMNFVGSLRVEIVNGNPAREKLEVDSASGDIVFVGNRVFVDTFEVGELASDDNVLEFTFANGAVSLVQKLVRALKYTSLTTSYAADEQRQIKISVSDSGGRRSDSAVTVKYANEAPKDIGLGGLSVQELAASGTVVGTLSATDVNVGDTFAYTLTDDAGGRFEVKEGKLQVKDGIRLDYEQARSHQVKVKVKDAAGAAFEKVFTIDLTDLKVEKTKGSVFNDVIKGGKSNDVLGGGLGNDVLWGGDGKNTLTGGKGKDTFVLTSKPSKKNVTKITDFNVKDDTIWLENKVFSKLGKKGTEKKPAKLDKKFFTIGEAAQDENDYLIYNDKTGKLYYDADGSGAKAAVEIAQLGKGLKMTAGDFLVI